MYSYLMVVIISPVMKGHPSSSPSFPLLSHPLPSSPTPPLTSLCHPQQLMSSFFNTILCGWLQGNLHSAQGWIWKYGNCINQTRWLRERFIKNYLINNKICKVVHRYYSIKLFIFKKQNRSAQHANTLLRRTHCR